jgi:hypothetical protein
MLNLAVEVEVDVEVDVDVEVEAEISVLDWLSFYVFLRIFKDLAKLLSFGFTHNRFYSSLFFIFV